MKVYTQHASSKFTLINRMMKFTRTQSSLMKFTHDKSGLRQGRYLLLPGIFSPDPAHARDVYERDRVKKLQ
jgi:hypothetical protein